MTRSQLTPTVITDTNGKVTTVYKRAAQPLPLGKQLPSPSPVAKKKRTYKPTPEQQDTKHRGLLSWHRRTDPDLVAALGIVSSYAQPRYVTFNASDVEMYSVFSATASVNARLLMEQGIRSNDEALDFLHSNGLEHLIEDHSEVMQKALERKFEFDWFILFSDHYFTKECDVSLFLDAAETNSVKGFREKPLPTPLPEMVLDGRIALSDLKAMTATLMQSSVAGEATVKALMAINSGTASYTAKQLRKCIEGSTSKISDTELIALADSCGIHTATGGYNKPRAYAVMKEAETRFKYEWFKLRDVVSYSERLSIYGRNEIDAETVITLYHSGVDVPDVVESLKKGLTVQQIIAIHAEGIPSSISTGWL